MLEVADLRLNYPDFRTNYRLTVPTGALCALIGPSGGGKTTLLHAIAGFAHAAEGDIRFKGASFAGLSPAERPLSILFQDHNLFPNLDAAQNIGLGISPKLRLTAADHGRIGDALAKVGLSGMEKRRPAQLSGGQRQRVALARSLVRRKPLMLLDEPFGGLDPGLRREMVRLVDDLRREEKLTVLISIHTPEDIGAAADLMAFVAEGEVLATGRPAELLNSKDPALARYLGGAPPVGPGAR